MPPDKTAVATSWKRESDVARDSRPDIVALHGLSFVWGGPVRKDKNISTAGWRHLPQTERPCIT